MFQGVFTAIITPFKNDKIDYDSYFKILDKQIFAGIDGIVPCGTTGESPTLTYEEHTELIQKTVLYVNKRAKVIAGTGSNSTREAIFLTEEACKSGVDGVLSVNPYYNKPTQEGLFQHFKSVAEASSVPVMLYNIPGRTAVSLTPDTIKKLSKVKNISSLKEATGDLNFMTRVISLVSPDFHILSGDDNLILPLLSIGGRGVVSVVSNIFPKTVKTIVDLFREGKLTEAREKFYEVYPIMHMAFIETNPIPVKAAMNWLGYASDEIRLPLTKLTSNSSSEEFKNKLFELKEKGFE
ncbi:MAG: 4-hydroxy-tetrahydrodipicolinate synthase [Leptospiraceae bacterium]|nr:4-hydroxy-tetrahydrodipicolinate synthase [Leptospiraceae bacterium]